MSGLWALLGIIILLGIGVRILLNMRVSEEDLKRVRKANRIQEDIDEAVAAKELEHRKELSAVSDFDRAAGMWDDRTPKT